VQSCLISVVVFCCCAALCYGAW